MGIGTLKIRMPRIHMPLNAVIEIIFASCIFHKSPLSDHFGCRSSFFRHIIGQGAQRGIREVMRVL
jgi:hypothetical protein